jgi:hypothetical protein
MGSWIATAQIQLIPVVCILEHLNEFLSPLGKVLPIAIIGNFLYNRDKMKEQPNLKPVSWLGDSLRVSGYRPYR